MKIEFGIQPGKVKSNIESFEGYTTLSFRPFESKINGLVLYLKSIYGITAQIPITDTKTNFSVPLKTYQFGWFEFADTDTQYVIEVDVE